MSALFKITQSWNVANELSWGQNACDATNELFFTAILYFR